jgi:hypothetical protein
MLSEIPRSVENARIGRLGRARWHKNSQPINLAKSYLLKLLDEKPMMRRRLKAGMATPLN